MSAEYDEGGAIGRRYRRQDEIGTPYAVTIDHQRSRTARSRCATATRSRRSACRSTGSPTSSSGVSPSRTWTSAMSRRRLRHAAPRTQVTYEDLYARWERGNWRATELDFTRGPARSGARRSREHERRAALWNYAMFFHGEDAVADDLAPFIDAAPREEQKYFLATQQVDEARHAVFFKRFMRGGRRASATARSPAALARASSPSSPGASARRSRCSTRSPARCAATARGSPSPAR